MWGGRKLGGVTVVGSGEALGGGVVGGGGSQRNGQCGRGKRERSSLNVKEGAARCEERWERRGKGRGSGEECHVTGTKHDVSFFMAVIIITSAGVVSRENLLISPVLCLA